ncbi:MAG: addiction module protein [Halothiobacillaceae bacterium]
MNGFFQSFPSHEGKIMPASTLPSDYLNLSLAERIQLVEDIWDGIALEAAGELDLTPTQRLEVQRRVAEHQADTSTAVAWEQVRAKLFAGEA